MPPVWSERPRSFAVELIEEGQVRVEARFVERAIFLRERKGVLPIVEVAQFDALGARIAGRGGQNEVLELRAAEAFESDRLSAARDGVLCDSGDQGAAIESL